MQEIETHIDVVTGEIREIRVPTLAEFLAKDSVTGRAFAAMFAQETGHDIATFFPPSSRYSPVVTTKRGSVFAWDWTLDETIRRTARAPMELIDEPLGGDNDPGEPRASRKETPKPYRYEPRGIREYAVTFGASQMRFPVESHPDAFAIAMAYAVAPTPVTVWENCRILYTVEAPAPAGSALNSEGEIG